MTLTPSPLTSHTQHKIASLIIATSWGIITYFCVLVSYPFLARSPRYYNVSELTPFFLLSRRLYRMRAIRWM